jgi:hypothetical protein
VGIIHRASTGDVRPMGQPRSKRVSVRQGLDDPLSVTHILQVWREPRSLQSLFGRECSLHYRVHQGSSVDDHRGLCLAIYSWKLWSMGDRTHLGRKKKGNVMRVYILRSRREPPIRLPRRVVTSEYIDVLTTDSWMEPVRFHFTHSSTNKASARVVVAVSRHTDWLEGIGRVVEKRGGVVLPFTWRGGEGVIIVRPIRQRQQQQMSLF